MDDLPAEIANADLLVSATGATGLVLPASSIRPRAGRPLVIVDIALPRDVDPAVAARPEVTYIDLDSVAQGRSHRQRDRSAARPPRSSTLSSVATSRSSSSWRSRRLSPRCDRRPTRSSTPSCFGWTAGCRGSTRRPAQRWPRPCVAPSRRCCTRPPFGSRSSPATRTATSTPRRCVNSSIWIRPHRSRSPPSGRPRSAAQ